MVEEERGRRRGSERKEGRKELLKVGEDRRRSRREFLSVKLVLVDRRSGSDSSRKGLWRRRKGQLRLDELSRRNSFLYHLLLPELLWLSPSTDSHFHCWLHLRSSFFVPSQDMRARGRRLERPRSKVESSSESFLLPPGGWMSSGEEGSTVERKGKGS